MPENELSYKIRGAIFRVHNFLGPGLLESSYEAALEYELLNMALTVEKQVNVPLIYRGVPLETFYRIDMVVEKRVLIELKSIDEITDVHHKQVLTYLRLSGLKLGILVNFNAIEIVKTIYRKVNNL